MNTITEMQDVKFNVIRKKYAIEYLKEIRYPYIKLTRFDSQQRTLIKKLYSTSSRLFLQLLFMSYL